MSEDFQKDLESLAMVADLPANRNATDRYRDFRQVFMGSDQGKRVLHDILGMCHLLRPSPISRPIDGLLMAMREGERNIGLGILSVMHNEPPPQPDQAQRQPKK